MLSFNRNDRIEYIVHSSHIAHSQSELLPRNFQSRLTENERKIETNREEKTTHNRNNSTRDEKIAKKFN